jgi:hypothetical protein
MQEWLEEHREYEAIVDGANIALYQQNFAEGGFSLTQVCAPLYTDFPTCCYAVHANSCSISNA